MTDYSASKIQGFIDVGLDKTLSNKARGDAFEDLFCYLLEELSGVRTKRNLVDYALSCEVDIVVANRQDGWMKQYPNIFFVECKNWSGGVDGKAVRDFAAKLADRCLQVGVLVAANKITGKPRSPAGPTSAYLEIALQQVQNCRIVVVTLDQLRVLKTPIEFETLLVDCLMETVGLVRH